jgi:hypothetical protein
MHTCVCIGVQTSVSKIITDDDVEIIHILLITDINYIAFIKYQIYKYGGLKYQKKHQGF